MRLYLYVMVRVSSVRIGSGVCLRLEPCGKRVASYTVSHRMSSKILNSILRRKPLLIGDAFLRTSGSQPPLAREPAAVPHWQADAPCRRPEARAAACRGAGRGHEGYQGWSAGASASVVAASPTQ
jgi:hypothetical protein